MITALYNIVMIYMCTVLVQSDTTLDVKYTDNTYEQYTICVNGEIWLTSGMTGFYNKGKWVSLQLNNVQNITGQDTIGTYYELVITWISIDNHSNIYETMIKQYPNEQDIIILSQSFPSQITDTSTNNPDAIISSFPSFLLNNNNFGYVKWGGKQLGGNTQIGLFGHKNNITGGREYSGPIAIFNANMSNCIVISSLTDYMSASDYTNPHNKTEIQYGLIGNISTINAGFKISFVISSTRNGGGVNTAMKRWGDIQLRYHNAKQKGNSHERDYTLNWLGYSTDNGAYYYYETEPDKNYQQTLFDIKSYHDKVGLPTKYVLLDSWWYYKGYNNGVKNWTARPDIFPDGMQAIYRTTKWKIQAHNRFWSLDNIYANNIAPYDKKSPGNFTFTYCSKSSLPTQAEFWKYLFDTTIDWGLIVYEQDWLSTVEDEIYSLSNSTTFGKQWLTQMATAARNSDINIQYCMSFPRHVLTSVQLESVTQVRASHDYKPGNDQWQIGISSIFTSCIDIAPSKDSYWSQSDKQSGHYPSGTHEPYNRLQSVVLSLSNGPVTFSDRIGYSNVSLIMKCCMMNGLLLRPDTSATMIDKYFVYNSGLNNSNDVFVHNGRIWSTYSLIGDNEMYKYVYVFAVNLDNDYDLLLTDIEYQLGDYDINSEWLVYEINTTSVFKTFSKDISLTIKKGNEYEFQLYTLIPIGNKNKNNNNSSNDMWYLAGEIDKWITVSNQRFNDITRNNNGSIHVTINGVVGETVHVAFVNIVTLKQQIVSCKIDETQQAIVHMPDAICLNYAHNN